MIVVIVINVDQGGHCACISVVTLVSAIAVRNVNKGGCCDRGDLRGNSIKKLWWWLL